MTNNVINVAIRLWDLFTPTVKNVNASLGSMKNHDEFVDSGVFVLGIDSAVENNFQVLYYMLIPSTQLRTFYQAGNYSMDSIRYFADAIKIGLDIVIGRLQHDKKIKQNQLNNYKRKYEELAS